ncbi:uncharacterized protein LOC143608044 [Bidens hawaiensis]|uniref:uncharacterized protein LOC143608044 n=1 Tax=Bidens hawaiensis TaxID=980011 RepID=UPI0040490577
MIRLFDINAANSAKLFLISMENNRLNINRPLLSVRRRTSSQNNTDNNRKTESCILVRPSVESCTTEIMNTGSVPFGWEHSPGRPKNEQVQTIESVPSLPKLPPGRFLSLKPMNNDAVTNISKITKSESIESTKKENLDVKYDADTNNDNGNEEDDDETYMDALDTLSRGETSFYNCSASGVSGFGSDAKPYRSVPDDPKMRDFMMGRFLPAAKAMAADLPQQHTFKKNVIKEKPQEVKKLVNIDDNNKKMLRYGPNFLQDVTPDKKSSKLCGLLPRFCSVNPVHGMCVRARLPISSAKGAQTSSSSSNSFGETDSEPARSGIYKHRSLDSILKNEPNRTSNLEGLKLYNRLQGNAISADLSGSFQSIVSEEIDSSSNKKGTSFKDLLANKNTNETETTDTQDTLVEKTLYVDTVQIIKSPQENKQPVFNESLKSDMFADEPKNDQETKKFEDHEVGLEVVDNIINDGDKQLKPSKTEVSL